MAASNILYLIFNALKLKTKRKTLKKRKSRTQKLPYLKYLIKLLVDCFLPFLINLAPIQTNGVNQLHCTFEDRYSMAYSLKCSMFPKLYS